MGQWVTMREGHNVGSLFSTEFLFTQKLKSNLDHIVWDSNFLRLKSIHYLYLYFLLRCMENMMDSKLRDQIKSLTHRTLKYYR